MTSKFSLDHMRSWYNEPLGRAILHSETSAINTILPKLFGYYLLQLGDPGVKNFLESSQIHHKILVNHEISTIVAHSYFIQATLEELPFLPESIDVIILFHTLEFSDQPTQIIKEAYQALIPGGTIIIFSYNPHSLLGLNRLFNKTSTYPWNGNFIAPMRLRHWLVTEQFNVGDYQTFFYRPPLQNSSIMNKLRFLEGVGQFFWPYFGASYMFVAQKLAVTMNLIRPKFLKNRPANAPSPATRCNKTSSQ